jgi:beta-glucuronidase
MVTEHYNHPSIVIWGILNECDSFTDYGRSCYQEQFAQIRELDPHRPTTYAACHHDRDRCQDLPDIAGWNRYAGWYSGEDVAQNFADLLAYAEPLGMAGKPLILSEFGGEGIVGFSDPVRRPRWSLERQADILKDSLDVYLKNPRISGAFIWQFCDVRVDESWAFARPRCINGKGIVDDFRRYKPAAEIVRAAFRARLGDFRNPSSSARETSGCP